MEEAATQMNQTLTLFYALELENAAEDLRVQYAQYRSDLQIQRGLIDNKDDFSCLAEVLASLPELQSITVNPGVFFFPHDNPHKLKSPFDHLFNACSQNAGKGLIRHVVAMFSALRCAVAKIEVLRLGPVDWGVLDLIVGVHSTPPEALSSLRHLELVLTIPLGDRNPCQALACREMMRSGALREFLRSLPQLEVLNVDFSSIGHRRQFAASVDDIIPADHTWVHLYSLALRNVEEEEQGFMSVMERHQRTLREVCLSNVRLATTSLPVLLDQIRDTMNLDYSCICGLIIGPPDAHGKKEWVLMRSELSGDWHRVINYVSSVTEDAHYYEFE
ncbi:hypothetical protein KJ359_010722 [Pestalotiopsis sp. 9143b]|nr:hypothetical protein KJ359_010722 [Pestalotiopsis sp. 9143b]